MPSTASFKIVDYAADVVVGWLASLLRLERRDKRIVIILVDALLSAWSVWIAFALRLGQIYSIKPETWLVLTAALAFWFAIAYPRGVYSAIFRFAGSRTMTKLATTTIIFAVPMTVIFMIVGIDGVPRTIGLLQPIIFFLMLAISRIIARYVLVDLLNARAFAGEQSVVAIYGAGSAGQQLALSLRHNPGMQLRGYIDDDPRLEGHVLEGTKIYHSSHIYRLIEDSAVETILLALPSESRQVRQRIMADLKDLSVRVMVLPDMQDLVDGKISVNDLRDVQIDDLLGRDPVPADPAMLSMTTAGKTVMVTGAGGSIGSELCRQIAEQNPRRLVLVEMTEHALYLIDAELRIAQASGAIDAGVEIVPELANVADAESFRRVCGHYRPQTIFHAAAYKHVPLVEANIISGLYNNVFGTLSAAQAASEFGVERFILISTDKAVRPTNVMGASKRVCELVLQAIAGSSTRTCFSMVRFGNVLGSSGSVIPRFQQQVRDGGPVTLTHKDVTRYFMTISEASQLVIQAGAMAEGGEVFVLDMGKSVKIMELARSLIQLSGLTVRDEQNPGGDIPIEIIGLRPGEKLYEELLIGNNPQPTSHSRIMQATEHCLPLEELQTELQHLRVALRTGNREAAMASLGSLVPEYAPQLATGEEMLSEAAE